MRWTYDNFTTLLLGLSVGMWGASWLAWLHPSVPFSLSYPVAGWTLWRAGDLLYRSPRR